MDLLRKCFQYDLVSACIVYNEWSEWVSRITVVYDNNNEHKNILLGLIYR